MRLLLLPALLALPLSLACGDKDDGGSDGSSDDGSSDDGGSDTGSSTDAVTRDGCEDRHEAFIAALRTELRAQDGPGVSAALMEDGVVTCRVALGDKRWDSDEPVDVDTLFQLGSTTKMLTSIALLQQVEDGAYDRETTLATAYPDSEFAYDDTWNDLVTMEHLLTHQGGFYDYIDWAADSDDADLVDWHEEIFFPYLWLMSAPGDLWNYSNPNFDLAGLVVEHNDPAGRWFREVMADEVFAPLGMTRTGMGNDFAAADGNFADSYGVWITSGGTAAEGEVAFEDVPDLAHGRPAGANTWSTPTDMLQVARFLIDGDPAVLADALHADFVSERAVIPSAAYAGLGYGYGLILAPGFELSDGYHATPIWEHGGNTLSYTSAFYVLPEQGFAVSILSSGQGTSWAGSVSTAIESLVALPAPTDGPTPPWDPDGLDAHPGTYEDAYNVGEMVITREGDTLHLSMPLLEELGYVVGEEMTPVTTDTWRMTLDGASYDLTFVDSDGDGVSDYAANRLFVGTRVPDVTATAAALPLRALRGGPLLEERIDGRPTLSLPAALR